MQFAHTRARWKDVVSYMWSYLGGSGGGGGGGGDCGGAGESGGESGGGSNIPRTSRIPHQGR